MLVWFLSWRLLVTVGHRNIYERVGDSVAPSADPPRHPWRWWAGLLLQEVQLVFIISRVYFAYSFTSIISKRTVCSYYREIRKKMKNLDYDFIKHHWRKEITWRKLICADNLQHYFEIYNYRLVLFVWDSQVEILLETAKNASQCILFCMGDFIFLIANYINFYIQNFALSRFIHSWNYRHNIFINFAN